MAMTKAERVARRLEIQEDADLGFIPPPPTSPGFEVEDAPILWVQIAAHVIEIVMLGGLLWLAWIR